MDPLIKSDNHRVRPEHTDELYVQQLELWAPLRAELFSGRTKDPYHEVSDSGSNQSNSDPLKQDRQGRRNGRHYELRPDNSQEAK